MRKAQMKLVSRSVSRHHSIEEDEKGKKRHRVHHDIHETYEYPEKKGAVSKVIAERGY